MKYSEIETVTLDRAEPKNAKSVRKHGPYYVKSVIDDTHAIPNVESVEELRAEHLKALGGGVDAATYLIRSPKQAAIIKLSYGGLEAETEALRAWRQHSVRVPEVLAQGIVPITKSHKKQVKYLIQKAMLDMRGRVVETCTEFLTLHPNRSRQVGEALGRQLARMHSVIAPRSFGEFADSNGNTAAYRTWNRYLLGYIDVNEDYLAGSLGLSPEVVEAIRDRILQQHFVPRGRYLHGDFSVRNAAVKSYDPLKVYIFDPNPVVGDPSWDLAALYNNYEFQKRRLEFSEDQRDLYTRDKQLLTGFKRAYNRRIHEDRLLIARFIQALLQAQYKENNKQDAATTLDLKVRRQFIAEVADQLSRRG